MALQLHIQIDAINPADNSTVVLRATNQNDPLATVQGGNSWLPVLRQIDELEMRFFSGDFSGDTAAQTGSLRLRATSVLNDEWSTYVTDGQRLQVWAASSLGTALTSATKIFDGYAGKMDRKLNEYTVEMKPAANLADNPVQTATYLGTGGSEGPTELKGKVKPYGLGVCKNVKPVLVNASKQIYHVSTTATALSGVFENGIGFTLGTSHASYAAMDAAASPATGAYDYTLDPSLGLFFRLGAEPAGLITCDFTGDLGAAAYAGTAVKTLLDRAGMPSWRYNASRVTAFNTAVSNVTVNRYFEEEQSIEQACKEILAGVGGYYGFDEEGILFLGLTRIGSSSATLSHSRDAEPLVRQMDQLPTSAPVWRLKLNAERVWKVHNSDEISDALKVAAADAAADAAAAQADADAALLELGRIATDSWLTSSEKKTMKTEYDAIVIEYNDIFAKGSLYGLTSLTSAYTTAKTNLDNYLTTLSPAWNDVTQDTPITRATWISTWSDYYVARQNLVNAMAQAAANAAAQTLTSIGSTTATILGSSFKRPNATDDYNCAVVGTQLIGSAFIGQAYTHTANCVFGLDGDNTTTALASQDYVFSCNTGAWTLYVDGVAASSGSGIPSGTKRLSMTYDGTAIRVYADGTLFASYSGADVLPAMTLYPKWWAKGRSDSIVGLTYTIYNDVGSILDSIANDNVISIQEKIGPLAKIITDMENRYKDLLARATTLGISTAAMTGARSDWNNFLINYAALDTSTDTEIYPSNVRVYADDTMLTGTGWDTANISSTANDGLYKQITDSDAANFKYVSRSINIPTSGTLVTQGVAIKKDSIPASTRCILIRPVTYSTVAGTKYTDIVMDTSTGDYISGQVNGGTAGWIMYDLGDEFYFVSAIITPEDNTVISMDIFPAISTGLSGGFDQTLTGSVSIRNHRACYGWTSNLGRDAFTGALGYYSRTMVLVSKAISETDGSTTDWVDGPTSANVLYTSDGSAIESNVDIDYVLKAGTGTVVTSGVTAVYRVLEGTVNGFDSNSADQSITLTSGVGTLSITSMTTATAKVQIRMTRNGLTKTTTLALTKTYSPPVSGGGSGGGSGDTPDQTSGFTNLLSSTYTTITNTLTFTMPTGKTTLRCLINLNCKMTLKNTCNQPGPWNVQFKVQRGGVDQGTAQDSNPDPYMDETSEGFIIANSGTLYYQLDMSSLTAGVQYSVVVQARISSGTLPTNGSQLNFTGSVTLSAP